MDKDSFIAYRKKTTFMKTCQKILKRDLMLQIMKYKDHYLQEKIKKLLVNKRYIRWKHNDGVWKFET